MLPRQFWQPIEGERARIALDVGHVRHHTGLRPPQMQLVGRGLEHQAAGIVGRQVERDLMGDARCDRCEGAGIARLDRAVMVAAWRPFALIER